MEEVQDYIEKIKVVFRINEYFNALDQKRFDECLDYFEEVFDSDYTSIVGGQPAVSMSRNMNTLAWKGMMAGFTSTHHLVGNHEVRFIDTNSCELKLKITATHFIAQDGGEFWTTAGNYEMALNRTQGVWRIKAIKFLQDWSQGSPSIMQKATEICQSRAKEN